MNVLPPLGNIRRNLSARVDHVRQSRFFHDRLSVGLVIAALIVNAFNFVTLIAKVHPSDVLLPVRYSSLDLGYTLGPWYYPYVVAFFALGVTLVNAVIAYQAFGRSRLASFYLILGAMVVAIFGFVISNALGVVR